MWCHRTFWVVVQLATDHRYCHQDLSYSATGGLPSMASKSVLRVTAKESLSMSVPGGPTMDNKVVHLGVGTGIVFI